MTSRLVGIPPAPRWGGGVTAAVPVPSSAAPPHSSPLHCPTPTPQSTPCIPRATPLVPLHPQSTPCIPRATPFVASASPEHPPSLLRTPLHSTLCTCLYTPKIHSPLCTPGCTLPLHSPLHPISQSHRSSPHPLHPICSTQGVAPQGWHVQDQGDTSLHALSVVRVTRP